MIENQENLRPQTGLKAKKWTEQVEDEYWATTIEPYDAKTFTGSIIQRQAGGYGLSKVNVAPHLLKRELKHIRRSEIADVLLIMINSGSCIVGYANTTIELSPTDLCLVNGWEPYSLHVPNDTEMLTFRMPCSALEARSKVKTEKLAFKHMEAQNGIPKITATVLNEAFNQLEHIPRGQDRVLLNNLASIVCASLQVMPDQDNDRSTYYEQLIRSVRRYIEKHIEDEGLNAEMIAQAHGISVRYLNKIFEFEPDTAVKYIRSLRLRLFSQRLLTDSSKSTIKELVFGCGFSDYAHFHRVFKRYFQCTPNEYRNRHNL